MASHSHSLFIAQHADTTSEERERERESISKGYHLTHTGGGGGGGNNVNIWHPVWWPEIGQDTPPVIDSLHDSLTKLMEPTVPDIANDPTHCFAEIDLSRRLIRQTYAHIFPLTVSLILQNYKFISSNLPHLLTRFLSTRSARQLLIFSEWALQIFRPSVSSIML